MKRLAVISSAMLAGFVLAAFLLVVLPRVGAGGAAPLPVGNGDTNGDGDINISDAVYTLIFLFRGGPAPVACAGSSDVEEQIAELRSELAQATRRIVDLEARPGLTPEQAEVFEYIHVTERNGGDYCVDDEYPENCELLPPTPVKTIVVEGANLQILNGTGSSSELNGLGNLIVGYQEERLLNGGNDCFDDHENVRTGSHNVVVGSRNNFGGWGGMVVGRSNSVAQPLSCVVGGSGNLARGDACFIGGGTGHWAIADRSGVIGGRRNRISDDDNQDVVISGGRDQTLGGAECRGE